MRRALNFWVVGGDLRQVKLAQFLVEDGHNVQTYAMEHRPNPGMLPGSDTMKGMDQADCVILPLPVTAEGGIINAALSDLRIPVEELLNELSPGQVVCAGRVTPQMRVLAEQKQLHGGAAQDDLRPSCAGHRLRPDWKDIGSSAPGHGSKSDGVRTKVRRPGLDRGLWL